MFNSMDKAVAFCEWLKQHGCAKFETKLLGASVEVDYITDYKLEAMIPAAFCKR